MNEKAASTVTQTNPLFHRVRLWLPVAVLVVAGIAATFVMSGGNPFGIQSYVFNGLPFEPPEPAPDFVLIDQHHQHVHLSEYQGKLVLLYFGFTHCPDECPVTIGTWKQITNLLEADADQVRFVMVTVDPNRDTPEQLREYLAFFNPDFIGLSGSLEDIEDVAIDYSVFFKKLELEEAKVRPSTLADAAHGHAHDHEEENYLVAHTTLTFLIDQSGQLTLAYPYGTGAQEIAADLRYLLQ